MYILFIFLYGVYVVGISVLVSGHRILEDTVTTIETLRQQWQTNPNQRAKVNPINRQSANRVSEEIQKSQSNKANWVEQKIRYKKMLS